jgi:multidrug efflux system outer membrane protein
VRSLKDRALEQYLATEQARTASQISLVAAVAASYLALAADLENLRLAEATLEAQRASYELIRGSRDLGMATDLDLRQAQSQVDVARVDAARFAGLVAVDRNALDLLAGAPVPDELLPQGLGEAAGASKLSPGLPSDVLLRRPDILAAEHMLQAANASIGAARAAFFPRISLTAAVGTMSDELSALFGSGTGTWTFVPQLTLPIFTGGSRRAGLEAAKVGRDIAVAEYEKAIQTAFREVSDALALRTNLRAQEEAQRSLVDALDEAHRLAEARYRAGIDSYLSVLVAQRALYAARQGLVAVRLAGAVNSITLFKALGGGAAEAEAVSASDVAGDLAREPAGADE